VEKGNPFHGRFSKASKARQISELLQARQSRAMRSNLVMNRDSHAKTPVENRPRNKANMDEPQEEFIESQPSRFEWDKEHGDELEYATHLHLWEQNAA
jgi:hypothetical protein